VNRKQGTIWRSGQQGPLNKFKPGQLPKRVPARTGSRTSLSRTSNVEVENGMENRHDESHAVSERKNNNNPSQREVAEPGLATRMFKPLPVAHGTEEVRRVRPDQLKERPPPKGGALWGTYDERENEADFQAALKEWRSGPTPIPSRSRSATASRGVGMGTESLDTAEAQRPTSSYRSLSYMEKLLARQKMRERGY
jgi:hypothetical protein